jgi:hypothetical protein
MNNEDTPVDIQEIKTKVCRKCGVEKPIEEFNKNKNHKDGLANQCKECARLYRIENKEKSAAYGKEYRKNNKEKVRARHKKYVAENAEKVKQRKRKHYLANKDKIKKTTKLYLEKNKEKISEYRKAYKAENRDLVNFNTAMYRARKLQATPNWLTEEQLEEIKDFYTICKMFQIYTGLTYHVDHMIPLRGEDVCGLHVPWNLQIIEASENLQKSNKLLEEFENAIYQG